MRPVNRNLAGLVVNPMNQIWLRHPNGNGKKFGNDCDVSADSYLDRQSAVGDSAEVYDSRLYGSRVSDSAVIHRASVWDSIIGGTARILGGEKGAVLAECMISGDTRVSENPTIYGVHLRNARVFGDAVLEGDWSLEDFVSIHRGTWKQPPRYKVIEDENIRVVLSECTDDHFHLGCWCLPRETWFRPGYRQRLGAHSGWTPDQIQFAFETFSEWAA